MFYITNYITKGDLNMHEMLSLLSCAVANLGDSPDESASPLVRSKMLPHKCLSHFTRQQQIHAQQAARYLRGHDDSIPSHKTVPMLSALLILYVTKAVHAKSLKSDVAHRTDRSRDGDKNRSEGEEKRSDTNVRECDGSNGDNDDVDKADGSDEDDDDDGDNYGDKEREDISLKIVLNRDRTLREANQVIDYLYQGETLSHMVFYDFCRCMKLERISVNPTKNTSDTRLGILRRHELKQGHPLAATHQLVEHTNELRGEGAGLLVPRVVGMSIPRKSDKAYHMFALAHFTPFDIENPLLSPGQNATEAFNPNGFSSRHVQILDNWEAIHECQDEQDAEQMRKRTEQARESRALTKTLHGSIKDGDEIEVDATRAGSRKTRDIQAETLISIV